MSFPLSVEKEAALCIYSEMVEFLSPVDTVFFAIENSTYLLSQSWVYLLGSSACSCLHTVVPMALSGQVQYSGCTKAKIHDRSKVTVMRTRQ